MGSVTDPGEVNQPPSPPPSFDEFQRQTSLMTSCTLLWKELSDHFTSLEQNLEKKSAALRSKMENFDSLTKFSLEILEERESTLSDSLALALKQLEKSKSEALSTISATDKVEIEENSEPEVDNSVGLFFKLKNLCAKMDSRRFWGFVILRKKEIENLRMEVPRALGECVDPPKLVLEAISEVFPVDNRKVEGGGLIGHDLGWACVLLLESLVPVMEDPVMGKKRMLVTPSVKAKAEEIAETWKRSLDERGGAENVKTPDVHTFLQHLVTFGIVKVEDLDLYRKLVVASAWRKQMPKLAVSLGLGDKMADMIEELISRGQHVDAVHFTYEVGLADKFPPVPLLKDFLKDAKKAIASILEDPSNSGRAQQIASKKEQSALRAVIRCIEEYKLENEFPSESLKKRLEQLEKVKIEKKKPIAAPPSPANKRTRANSGGPMPPAKAGRLTNAYVSSFPSAPAFVRSPPSQTQYTAAVPQYASPPYSSPPQAMYGHGGRSPPYAYSPEPYAGSPVSYPAYGGYANGIPAAYPTAYY